MCPVQFLEEKYQNPKEHTVTANMGWYQTAETKASARDMPKTAKNAASKNNVKKGMILHCF